MEDRQGKLGERRQKRHRSLEISPRVQIGVLIALATIIVYLIFFR